MSRWRKWDVLKRTRQRTIIGIRLSDECHARLMQYASEHKLTITQVVQRALELLFQSS